MGNQPLNRREIARLIDHTLLKPEAAPEQVRQICREAREWGFFSVCINPIFVPLAMEELAGSGVKVSTVIGFPLGATTTAVKALEAREAAAAGAAEVDMVLPVGALKAGDCRRVRNDISGVVSAVAGQALIKVILETALLTTEEILCACHVAREAGAHFVKTSTGFSTGGATREHVALMRRAVGTGLGVKASGGIRTLETLLEMVAAGANRIGSSSGVTILQAVPVGGITGP